MNSGRTWKSGQPTSEIQAYGLWMCSRGDQIHGWGQKMLISGGKFLEVQGVSQAITNMPIHLLGRWTRARVGKGRTLAIRMYPKEGRIRRFRELDWKLIQPTWGMKWVLGYGSMPDGPLVSVGAGFKCTPSNCNEAHQLLGDLWGIFDSILFCCVPFAILSNNFHRDFSPSFFFSHCHCLSSDLLSLRFGLLQHPFHWPPCFSSSLIHPSYSGTILFPEHGCQQIIHLLKQ